MTQAQAPAAEQLQAYEVLQYYTLAHAGKEFVHQHAVDAWAAQHAGSETRPIGLTFALVGLYLHVERGLSGRQVQQMHMRLARSDARWPSFELPEERGSVTVLEVVAAPAGPARDRALTEWCSSVWGAFRESHQAVVELLKDHDIE